MFHILYETKKILIMLSHLHIINWEDDHMNQNRKNHPDIIIPKIGSDCICSNCGHHEPSQLNIPCYHRKCPKCGAPLADS